MKKWSLILLLSVSVSILNGCVSVSEKETKSNNTLSIASSQSVIWEIDAASRMSFDEDRQRAYKQIALRASLDEDTQAYLVKAVFDHLAFESAKQDVLLTIIRHPAFNGTARNEILQRINKLSFENDKEIILRAINDKKI